MELPFEKTVCRHWKQTLYTLLNREETQEIRLPEGMPDMGRIISSWGQVILRGKDWRDRGVGITGGVMVWILYAPEDGGALQHLESWIPFQARTEMPEAGRDGVIRVETFLRNLDARITSSRKIMVRTGVSLVVQAMVPDELELVTLGELPEDLEVKVERYPFQLTREAGEKTFLVEEELTLPERLPGAEQLVYYYIRPEIQEQKVLGSKAAFRGIGNLHVLYLDQDGRLTGTDFQVPFAQYVDLDGEYEEDAQVMNLLCVTSLELEILPEGKLRLKCGLVSQYTVQSQELVELLEDCYSPCREVAMEKQLVSIPAWLDQQQRGVELSASFSAEEGQPIDLIFFPDPPEVNRAGGTAQIEQGGTFQTVLRDDSGSYTGKNQHESGGFSWDSACDTICFQVGLSEPSSRREAGSWRTDTRVMLDLASLCNQPMEMVTKIHLGEEGTPDPERPSVIIRARQKQESLWDLAKRCGSTVGAIKRLNHLEGEPEEDRLLLIPVL